MGHRTVLLFTLAAATFGFVAAHAQSPATKTTWDGVFTDAQADRGGKLYVDQCASCHGTEMRAGAGAPSLAGPEFTFGWDKKPLGGLFDFMRQNMPPGQAGSLEDGEYTEILAAILKRNGMPGSATIELPSTKAALDAITFLSDKP